MERGPAHSHEDAMSNLQTQNQTVQTSQLLYKPSDRKTASGEIIRSKKTAELLCLSKDGAQQQREPFGSRGSSARLKSLRRGGFLRSRMTAELLGVDLIGR